MAQMRLDKLLGEMGIGTRNQVKEQIRKGNVWINGCPAKKSDLKVDPDRDRIQVNGKEISYVAKEYYLLNKPKGVVSATKDPVHPTVIGLLADAKRKDLFPVGRLDIDTEGLLLITNDGDLAHRLLSPKKHVDKVYYAQVKGRLPSNSVSMMEQGLTLKDQTKALPARLAIRKQWQAISGWEAEVFLTIREGKFHQVKRMFEAVGCEVTYLKRIAMGPLALDENLACGQYRALTRQEIECLEKLQNEGEEA